MYKITHNFYLDDGTRVRLEVSSFNEGTDYINANIIKVRKNNREIKEKVIKHFFQKLI